MHKATIVSRSMISGDWESTIEDADLTLFHAKVVGAVQGATAAGAVIVSLTTSQEN